MEELLKTCKHLLTLPGALEEKDSRNLWHFCASFCRAVPLARGLENAPIRPRVVQVGGQPTLVFRSPNAFELLPC